VGEGKDEIRGKDMKQKEFSFPKFYEEIISQKCLKNPMNPCGNQAITGLITPNGYLPICESCLGKVA
jgi:hypothetical protein